VNELKHSTGAETVITVRYEEAVPVGTTEKTGLAGRPGVSKVETDGTTSGSSPANPRHAR